MKRIAHAGSRALLLAALLAAMGVAARVGAAEELALRGHVRADTPSAIRPHVLRETFAFGGTAPSTTLGPHP